jgi:hypothetical protein
MRGLIGRVGPAVVGAWLASATPADAAVVTYSGIQESLSAHTEARVVQTQMDTSVDAASATTYANIVSASSVDTDPAGGDYAIAAASADLNITLSPTSTPLAPFVFWVDGGAGTDEQLSGTGKAAGRGEAALSFGFEVDQVTPFSLYLTLELDDGDGHIALYNPDGSILLGLIPSGVPAPSYTVGLSGYLQPGGVYRLDALGVGDAAVLGTGTGSNHSGARFHADLIFVNLSVPEPSAWTLLVAALPLALARRSTCKRYG